MNSPGPATCIAMTEVRCTADKPISEATHFSDDWLHKLPWAMRGHRCGLILPGNSENGNYQPISVSNTVHSHGDQFLTDSSHNGLR